MQEQVDEARKRNQVLPDMLNAELLKLRVDAFCKLVQAHSQVQMSDAQVQALRWTARVSANSYWTSLPDAMIGRATGDYFTKTPTCLNLPVNLQQKVRRVTFDVSQWLPWATLALSFVPGVGGLLGKAASILFGSITKSKDRAARMALLRTKLGSTPKSKTVEFLMPMARFTEVETNFTNRYIRTFFWTYRSFVASFLLLPLLRCSLTYLSFLPP